jgi:CheY-like chemotaxis protein
MDQPTSIVVSAPSQQPHGIQKTETILVAEDDPTDAFFLERAFSKLGVPIALHFVRDGQEVIDYLSGEGEFANRSAHPSPDLLVLDLKMPRVDGFEVLNWVRQHPRLKLLPVIIFSSSAQNTDINRAYDLGANSYLVKPHATEDLLVVVEKLKNYWIESNKKPDDLAE